MALLSADDEVQIQDEAGAAGMLCDAGVTAISAIGAWGGVKGHSKASWTVYVMTFTNPRDPLIGDVVAHRELWRAALGPELAALADDHDTVARCSSDVRQPSATGWSGTDSGSRCTCPAPA